MKTEEPATFPEAITLLGSLDGFIFRGQRAFDWNLTTSLERNEERRRSIGGVVPNLERDIIYHYRRTAYHFLRRVPPHSDTVEWISILQHYGAPTRFLDFTKSFWVALFFAAEDADSDCAIWAARMTSFHPKHEGLNLNTEVGQAIGVEPYQRAKKPDDVFYDEPYHLHERLVLQKGVFVFTVGDTDLQSSLAKSLKTDLIKIRIQMKWFPDLWKQLRAMNINSAVLYPGIDGFSRRFRNDWT